MDGIFSRLAKVYLLDKTKPCFGLVTLTLFQGHRRIFIKTCIESVDGFHQMYCLGKPKM